MQNGCEIRFQKSQILRELEAENRKNWQPFGRVTNFYGFLQITPLRINIFKNGFRSQSAVFKAHLLIYSIIRSRTIFFAHFRNFGDF